VSFLQGLVTAIIIAVLVVFAVSNRATVELEFWPLPVLVQAPLFLVVLAALIVGLIGGAVAVWIGGLKRRQETRELRRRLARVERDVAMPASGDVPAIERR